MPHSPLPYFDTAQGFEQHRSWERTLFDAGWAAVSWPQRYGGRDATAIQSMLFEDEYAKADAPARVNQNGLAMLGPTLMAYGTPAQKDRFLVRLASGRDIWAQGWSEPNAGSDLASVQSRAVRNGEHYVLNGQKTWVSRGGHADWMFSIVRTGAGSAGHRGLTFLLIPLRIEGITVRSIEEIDGRSSFAEIFMDGARVPVENVVGVEDEGWAVAMATLGFERSAFLRPPGRFSHTVARLLRLAQSQGYEPTLRHDLAEAWAATEVYRLLNLWSSRAQHAAHTDEVNANVNKLAWSEMDIHIHELALRLLGSRAELFTGASDAVEDGHWMREYLFSLAGTIYAGTSEVQRNIIAERGLGLPRE